MKATMALPTEERVQRMNDQQWLWYYLNLVEDETEDEKKTKMRLDYLGWWINPKLAQSVMEEEKLKERREKNKQNGIRQIGGYDLEDPNDSNGLIHYEDTAINTAFEEEMQKALKEAGSDGEFIELPDSTNAGNPYESADDFLSRVSSIGQTINQQNNEIPIGFENPEEYEEYIDAQNNQNEDHNTESFKEGDPKDPEFIKALRRAGINPDDVDYFDVD